MITSKKFPSDQEFSKTQNSTLSGCSQLTAAAELEFLRACELGWWAGLLRPARGGASRPCPGPAPLPPRFLLTHHLIWKHLCCEALSNVGANPVQLRLER